MISSIHNKKAADITSNNSWSNLVTELWGRANLRPRIPHVNVPLIFIHIVLLSWGPLSFGKIFHGYVETSKGQVEGVKHKIVGDIRGTIGGCREKAYYG